MIESKVGAKSSNYQHRIALLNENLLIMKGVNGARGSEVVIDYLMLSV